MITQSSLLTSSAAAGVVVHNGLFIRGTWHLRAPSVVIAHIALGFALWFFVPDDSANKHSWEHLATCASMYGCYLAALFTSMTIYRLYFHRLRHFPGPRLAAISKLWHVAHCLGARNYLVLDELRKKYGPFVRTGEAPSARAWREIEVLNNQARTKSPSLSPAPSTSSTYPRIKPNEQTGTRSSSRAPLWSSHAARQSTPSAGGCGRKRWVPRVSPPGN